MANKPLLHPLGSLSLTTYADLRATFALGELPNIPRPEFLVLDFVVSPTINRHFVCLECSLAKGTRSWLGLYEFRGFTTQDGIKISRLQAWATQIKRGELFWEPILDASKNRARYYTKTGNQLKVDESDSDGGLLIEMPPPKELTPTPKKASPLKDTPSSKMVRRFPPKTQGYV
ncbi:MAG: hypothetical protein WCG04_00430 [Alphaproteobacteria bacterium]